MSCLCRCPDFQVSCPVSLYTVRVYLCSYVNAVHCTEQPYSYYVDIRTPYLLNRPRVPGTVAAG